MFVGLPLVAIGLLLGACNSPQAKGGEGDIRFPAYVTDAPQGVREAYQFAVDHPERLQFIPCWCPCGAQGHQSNLDCYVAGVNGDGSLIFTDHAAN